MAEATNQRDRRGTRGHARASSWIAWSLAALSVLMYLASVALWVLLVRSVQVPGSSGGDLPMAALILYLPFLAFPIVGALIASGRPQNPIGWILLAVGLLWMLNLLTASYVVYGLRVAAPGSVPYPAAIEPMAEWLGPAAVLLFGTYLIPLFPEGKPPSSGWCPVAWLCRTVIVANVVVTSISAGHLSDLSAVRKPFVLQGYPWLADATDAVGQS